MVKQTIQAIKETEAKAGVIVKDAQVQCKKILEDASKQAQKRKEENIEKALKEAESMMEAVRAQGEQIQQKAAVAVENEVGVLKQLAFEKEETAVGLAIAQLI